MPFAPVHTAQILGNYFKTIKLSKNDINISCSPNLVVLREQKTPKWLLWFMWFFAFENPLLVKWMQANSQTILAGFFF